MPFSIAAVDQANKETSLAIASCAWNVGMVCRIKTKTETFAFQIQGNLFLLRKMKKRK